MAWWNECDCDCLQKNIKKGCTIYFNNVILRLLMVIKIPDQKIYTMFFFHQFRRKICWHQQIQHSTSNDTWDVQASVDVRHDVVGTCWNIFKTNKWKTNNKKCQHVVLMSFTSKKEQWKDFTRSLLLNDVLFKFLTRCPKIVFSVCIWFPQKYSITWTRFRVAEFYSTGGFAIM